MKGLLCRLLMLIGSCFKFFCASKTVLLFKLVGLNLATATVITRVLLGFLCGVNSSRDVFSFFDRVSFLICLSCSFKV